MQQDVSDETASDIHTQGVETGSGGQVLIVLCGLIGCGKSSFANALQLYHPEYIRCNQDALGSRKAVVSLASKSLREGKSVTIDRTNVDEAQRATWVDLAKSFGNLETQAIIFDTPLDICKQRLAIRTDHETIKDPEHALHVLQCFSRDFQAPKHSEGFSKIISVTPADFASVLPSRAEVDAVLGRLADAPRVDVPIVRAAPVESHQSRGRGRGGRWAARGASAYRGGFDGYRGASQADWRSRAEPVQQVNPASMNHPSTLVHQNPAQPYQQHQPLSAYQYTAQTHPHESHRPMQ